MLNKENCICFFVLFFAIYFDGLSQDGTIPLASDFLSEATQFKVKNKSSAHDIHKKRWKKPWKCFGPYSLCNWNKTPSDHGSKRNFWGTKFEQSEFTEWIYDLAASGLDTLNVNVAYSFYSKEKYSIQPLSEIPVSFGESGLQSEKFNVAASIQSRDDSEEPWMLLLSLKEGMEEIPGFTGLFFRANESFEVVPLSSEGVSQMGGLIGSTAKGYVFENDGRPVAAVQNFSSNIWKPHDRYVWIASSLDQKQKMSLSAAISVLLLLKDDRNFLQASGIQVYSEE